ncbi:3-oxoacyl-[acyl-carrier-protein] synthase [Phytophthora cactorum]|nr:3-oxoacyl-[acyl-carrier-protein] synthase [Phytophthora cactorum]KAG3105560.1 3-oxoacyl-[acyl-carrier-protein] synthase [Phytophthora cactorum]KAG4064812.1 3-oxoacyl-[acyl-carrier-protein] synthase [Phytophthora cactorum]
MLVDSGLNCTVGATVPRGNGQGVFHTKDWTNPKSFRAQEVDHVAIALAAADEAFKNSGWTPQSDEERERAEVMNVGELTREKKFRRVTPFFVPRIFINLAAGHVSIEHELKGPVHSCVTACATGSHSIDDAARFIQHGDADVMVAGGTEPTINEMSICAFDGPRALSTKYNDRPKEASRPFDLKRAGFVMVEGAGIVVLEEYEHAKKRGARIYAELRGYGDGSHITAPLQNGDGARTAMQSAVAQSGLALSDVGYVNAHAAGTLLGDHAENEAIKNLFGEHAENLAVSSTKGSIGHLQGSAVAVEEIFAIKALHHNVMPPTLNLTETTEEFTLNYVPNQSQEKELHAVMSNLFGFGGTNASLLFANLRVTRGFSTLSFGAPPPAPNRRVVVTGLGAVTPFGVGVSRSWDALLDSQCAIQTVDALADTGLNCTIGAAVPRGEGDGAFRTKDWVNLKNLRAQEPDFIAFTLAAAEEALKDSGWSPQSDEERERAGVAIGAGMGNIQEVMDVGQLIKDRKYRRVSPFFITRILINLAAGHVSIEHGLKGPNHSCVTACATGSHSIGDAANLIRHGNADVMVAGGTEASLNEISVCAFSRAQALSTKFNDRPQEASRPFDSERDGFVMGEGAGVVVLEEYEHAKKRGAKIYAEVRGYGLSGDSNHITAPLETGDGARRAMGAAIAQSGLALSDIGYINAHATSTPLGDRAENAAVKELFGEHANELAMSSTKGAIGHLLGAAGAVEAIFSIKSLHHNVMPPTLNLTETTEEFTLNYVPNQPQEKELRAVLTNSFGFGGTNASLLFAK